MKSGEFFSDPDRAASGEVDFGVWWSEDAQQFPKWRVSWIEKTGELYAVELVSGEGRVEIFGSFSSRDRVEAALSGWENECEKPASLEWVRFSASVEKGLSALEQIAANQRFIDERMRADTQ